MKKVLIALFAAALVSPAVGQIPTPQVLDGLYTPETNPRRTPIPWSPLREADVIWSKRIWRSIDLREKINHPLYYPNEPTNGRMSMFDIIKTGIESGEIIPFSDTYDDFRQQLTREEALAKLESVSMAQVEDPDNPGFYFDVSDTTRITSRDIIAYELKEDWFIDKQRSVLDVRIIGICPVIVTRDPETGAERGKARLFWLYFPNLRAPFAMNEVFNRSNDTERRTLDDIFWKRMFSSYVIKESNVYDRSILEYLQGIDALLRSEEVKDEIFSLEHDMWHY